MQAIVTKFLGPTNHRGSRVKAWCEAGSVTVSWDHAKDVGGNHDAAAEALIRKLGWDAPCYRGRWVGGGLPNTTGNAYVFCPKDSSIPDVPRVTT
jgi:hypothetical protein